MGKLSLHGLTVGSHDPLAEIVLRLLMATLQGGLVGLDPSRIAAQVVSGIGFLGAGTIILQRVRPWETVP